MLINFFAAKLTNFKKTLREIATEIKLDNQELKLNNSIGLREQSEYSSKRLTYILVFFGALFWLTKILYQSLATSYKIDKSHLFIITSILLAVSIFLLIKLGIYVYHEGVILANLGTTNVSLKSIKSQIDRFHELIFLSTFYMVMVSYIAVSFIASSKNPYFNTLIYIIFFIILIKLFLTIKVGKLILVTLAIFTLFCYYSLNVNIMTLWLIPDLSDTQ